MPYGHAQLSQLKGQELQDVRNKIKSKYGAQQRQVLSDASLPTPTGWGGSVETALVASSVPYQAPSTGGAGEAARCNLAHLQILGASRQLLLTH